MRAHVHLRYVHCTRSMTRACLLFRNDNSFKVLKYNISQSDIESTKIVTERYPAKGDSCSSRI